VSTSSLEDIPEVTRQAYEYLQEEHPDALINVKRLMVGPQPDGKIEARISGPDPDVLRQIAAEFKAVYLRQPGGTAVRDDWRSRTKVLRPQFSEAQARRAGISKTDIDDALLFSFAGKPIGLYRDGTQLLPIILRPPKLQRDEIGTLQQIKVWSPTSASYIPLDELISEFTVAWEDPLIIRRDRKRTITVMMEANPLYDITVADLQASLQAEIEALDLPKGYEMEWGGEYEKSSDAKEPIFETLPLGFLAMFLITVVLFNSIKKSLVVWCTVPLAVIGVSAALILADKPFSFMALLGMLSLSGMLIKNGIVLMDQIAVEMEEGADSYNAVFDAAVSRARPVSMAAATTILGMIPLLPDLFFQSMAVTIMGGLAFATLLTLIIVPVLYVTFFRIPYQPAATAGPTAD
jgi:multidrug efflux pump subunit AcrB